MYKRQGIIGVCTAYYLTRHPSFSPEKHHITVLESKRVAGGASGKAGGLLATWAFPQQIVPLSFQLHQELSDEFDGENEWDYRRLTTVSLEADVQNVSESVDNSDAGSAKSCNSRSHTLSTRKKSREPKAPTPKNKKRCAQVTRSDREDSDGDDESDDEDNDDLDDKNTDSDELQESYGMGMTEEASPKLPEDLNWIRTQLVRDWSSLGGTDSTCLLYTSRCV